MTIQNITAVHQTAEGTVRLELFEYVVQPDFDVTCAFRKISPADLLNYITMRGQKSVQATEKPRQTHEVLADFTARRYNIIESMVYFQHFTRNEAEVID